MSIIERLDKIKPWLLPINIILVGTFAFGLGRWSRIEESKTPVLIEETIIPVAPLTTSQITSQKSSGIFVASKNGTKYYYPRCAGAARIKEENKIWFASREEAARRGYAPAANCPGL